MEEIKKLKRKSYFGLFLFICSLFICYNFLNHIYLGLIGIIMLVSGWYIFSKNHTQITIIKVKEITDDYIKDKLN